MKLNFKTTGRDYTEDCNLAHRGADTEITESRVAELGNAIAGLFRSIDVDGNSSESLRDVGFSVSVDFDEFGFPIDAKTGKEVPAGGLTVRIENIGRAVPDEAPAPKDDPQLVAQEIARQASERAAIDAERRRLGMKPLAAQKS